jgi:hypothetical protein
VRLRPGGKTTPTRATIGNGATMAAAARTTAVALTTAAAGPSGHSRSISRCARRT